MRKLLVTILILGLLGYAGYQYAIRYASDLVMDQVAEHVLNGEKMEDMLTDPEVKKLLEGEIARTSTEGATKDLPFRTKEEALKALAKKFSAAELNEIRSKVTDGISAREKEELVAMLEQKLSPEELEALKMIALKELQSKGNGE